MKLPLKASSLFFLASMLVFSWCFVSFVNSYLDYLQASLFQGRPMFVLDEIPVEDPPLEEYHSSAEEEPYIPSKNTLVFGGDVMLSRYVDIQMRKHKNYKGPFEGIAEYLRNADIAFINLEAPFNPTPRHFSLGMSFGADILALEGLLFAGIDIVSLANNHFGDSGVAGMTYTMDELSNNNIYYVGAGEATTSANYPTYITSNGITFGFLAYSSISPYYQATDIKPGFALMPDTETLKSHIERAKRFADVVIVTVHTGNEYVRYPSQRFIDFAHSAIDNGATLVIGHHPHVVQPIEWYKDGFIAYSLGNLIFDQYFEGTKEGIMVKTEFEDTKLSDVEIQPIVIESLWKSRLANEEEGKSAMQRTQW